jgi:hypothetical protein
VKKPLLVLAVSIAIGLGASVASAATTCHPVLTPGENLARVAARCPPSTTFIIKDGTYKLSRAVVANSGDTFKGLYSDKSRPQIDANGAAIAFNVGGTNRVTISGLSISGTKGGKGCKPACGGGIKKDGRNLHVLNVRLHHNPNQGIGNPGPGFVLKNSEIDHNGSAAFTSGSASSAGVKITQGPATFKNNRIHHNYWHGIWCDGFAVSIVIRGNVVHHNGKSGIRYEICRGPGSKITKNRVFANGHLKKDKGSRAGIVLVGAQDVGVANNILRGNRGSGIKAKTSDRQRTSRVKIHHNTLRNDTLKGCKLAGVVCWANGK